MVLTQVHKTHKCPASLYNMCEAQSAVHEMLHLFTRVHNLIYNTELSLSLTLFHTHSYNMYAYVHELLANSAFKTKLWLKWDLTVSTAFLV